MKLLEIKAADSKSVSIKFMPEGVLSIEGVSCDEDPKPFYSVLIDWVKEYISKPAENTELFIRLKYFNTSSARCLLELLNGFTPLIKAGKKFTITWYYEDGDEDMLDSIKVFEDILHYKIDQVKISSYI